MPRPDHPAIRMLFEAAAAEAERSPPPTAGLNPGVVMEWHYALNWLIGYEAAK